MDNYTDEEKIIKKFGRGFYRASFIFPKKVRKATWIYYAFVRYIDEIVDGVDSLDEKKGKIQQIEKDWQATLNGNTENVLFTKYAQLLKTYDIPIKFTDGFMDSMKMDLYKNRYDTYADLEVYMYGSATVVGYTMSYIIGFEKDTNALSFARDLAESFQMTNFIRDIYDDYVNRNRIYIPKEDLDRFGVTEYHIKNKIIDEKFVTLLKFEIARSKMLLDKGISGIHFLNKDSRRAVYASALIYKDLLSQIEKNTYDIFSKRITVSPFRKTMLLLKAICKINL